VANELADSIEEAIISQVGKGLWRILNELPFGNTIISQNLSLAKQNITAMAVNRHTNVSSPRFKKFSLFASRELRLSDGLKGSYPFGSLELLPGVESPELFPVWKAEDFRDSR
jgi:hypothetical protein